MYRIPEIASKHMKYDMIQMHTELPDFPNDRTKLLFAFLRNGTLMPEKAELFSLVTSIVQMGLDTHDLVSDENIRGKQAEQENKARSRQFKVLAGDFFSSKFYHLLSQAGEIEMVRQISEAICEVNALKMNLYLKMKQLKLSAEEYVQKSVQIKIQLYAAFDRFMSKSNAAHWLSILECLTRCEVYLAETERFSSKDAFRDSWGFWQIVKNGAKEEIKFLNGIDNDPSKFQSLLLKYNINSALYRSLELQVQQFLSAIQQLGSEKLIQEIHLIGQPFMKYLPTPKLLEEI